MRAADDAPFPPSVRPTGASASLRPPPRAEIEARYCAAVVDAGAIGPLVALLSKGAGQDAARWAAGALA